MKRYQEAQQKMIETFRWPAQLAAEAGTISYKSEGRRLLCFMVAVLAMCLLSTTARADTGERKLTLMIYMCGSNLESEHGSATMDIQEMLDAGISPGKVSVLIMTGGSKTSGSAGYFDSDSTCIYEINGNRIRRVWQSEKPMNMGDEMTLWNLIRFGQMERPSEQYALIIWDHGAGPLEGTCWDELHGSDHLTLQEIIDSLETSFGRHKLSWLGFDACLMGSLEVSTGLSAVAEYMIASQETEPSFGWNYSFLKNIENDKNASVTGKRIVDAYFEGREDTGQVLTLSCIDLSKAAAAANAVGAFFSEVEKEITAESYPNLAIKRNGVRDFGSGLRGIEDDNAYDLVDAEDLLSQIEGDQAKKEAAVKAIREAVVYQRSNADKTCGLTLYHPWQNKEKFEAEWSINYRSMDLIKGYTKYVQSFGMLLTDKELIRWKDLETRGERLNEEGKQSFSVQLSEEEASHLASAQMLVIKERITGNRLGTGVTVVGAEQASISDDNKIQAVYSEKAFYVEEENGYLIGPISFTQTSDGKYNVLSANFIPEGEYDFDHASRALFYISAEDKSDNPEILFTRIWDEQTESYSTRSSLNPDKYRMVYFWDYKKEYPMPEDGVLPDYYIWKNSNSSSHYALPLPNDWHFVQKTGQLSGEQLYAMFRITDVQQNVYCSVPTPITNANRSYIQIKHDSGEIPNLEFALNGYMDISRNQSLCLELEIRNTGEKDLLYDDKALVINGNREVNGFIGYDRMIPAGGAIVREVTVPAIQLALLDEIRTVSFNACWGIKEISEETEIGFTFETDCLKRINVPMSKGHAYSNGITMDVLNVSLWETSGFDMTILIENQRDESIQLNNLALNGYELQAKMDVSEVSAKRSVVAHCIWENGLVLDGATFELSNGRDFALDDLVILGHWLELHNQYEINTLDALFYESSDSSYNNPFLLHCDLPVSWEVKENNAPGENYIFSEVLIPDESYEDVPLAVMTENERLTIKYRHALLGKKQLVLIMEAVNDGDNILKLGVEWAFVNDVPIQIQFGSPLGVLGSTCKVSPGCINAMYVILDVSDLLEKEHEIRSVSLLFYEEGGEICNPVKISFMEPLKESEQGKLLWASSDDVIIKEEDSETNDSITKEQGQETWPIVPKIVLPDDVRNYLHWIKAPLTDEELKNVEKGELLLVVPREGNDFIIAGFENMAINDAGELYALFPGLILCSSSEEGRIFPVKYYNTDATGFEMESISVFTEVRRLTWKNDKSMIIESMKLSVDCASNEGTVKELETSGDLINQQREMRIFELFPIHLYFPTRENGDYVSQKDAVFDSTDLVSWKLILPIGPLELKMRPISADDRIQFMFSIYNKDGTSYSRLVPWEEIYKVSIDSHSDLLN